MKTKQQSLYRLVVVVAATVVMAASSQRALADGVNNFTQTNLVSDIPGLAKTTDPDLVNPWGVALSSGSPFWVSDNHSGLATLYNGEGVKQGLVVTIPGVGGNPAAPTGVIFNSTTSFNSDLFIFGTEDGTIAGWRGALGTTAETLLNSTGINSVFKGLAIANTSTGTYLYATDFHNNSITVVPGVGAPALAGTFTDPSLPAGYAPFNIENINGQLYVTYAVQDAAKHDDVAGAGNGIIDVYDLQGNFVKRLITGGQLDSPWGMALAPASFGSFGKDLLVGNFGDGTINAFDPVTGSPLGTLDGGNGLPLVNLGLWDLTFGNGVNGGLTSDLYFTAGIPGGGTVEDHGLFGSIATTPEPGTLMLIGSGLLGLLVYGRRRIGALA